LAEAAMIPDRFSATLVDIVAHLLRTRIDTGVANCVLTLAGRIDERRLNRALRLAMDVEPIGGCRFVEHWFRPCWQRRGDLDTLPLCTVREGEGQAAAMAHYLTESLDPTCDPLVKILVFRGAVDTLCLKACHTVADGPSLATVFQLLSTIYRRLKTEPDYRPVPNPGPRDLKIVARQFGFRERMRFLREIVADRAEPPGSWRFPPCGGRDRFRGYILLRLPPERVRALSADARRQGATMTAVMLAGLYLAALNVFQTTGSGRVAFSTTTDMRRFLPRDQRRTAVSNMSAPARFRLDPSRQRTYAEVLPAIRDQLQVIHKDPTRMASLMSLMVALPGVNRVLEWLPFTVLRRRIDNMTTQLGTRPDRRWTMANLGELALESLEFGDVAIDDAYFTGPLYVGPGVGLVCSMFHKTLTLGVGVSDRVMDEAVARRLLEEVDRQLPFRTEGAGAVQTIAAGKAAAGAREGGD
jgi:NRPS condensation-like uncharacterized protein